MIKNYLLITFRSMMKNKVYIFINILGMAISIACCITAYYNYNFNATFDTYHANAKEIYRVNSIRDFQGRSSEYGIVPIPLPEIARQNAKDAVALTRYNTSYADFRINDEIFDNVISYVDPDFFNMFTVEFLQGDASALKDKAKILISDENSIRLFGTVNSLGRTVTRLVNVNEKTEYEVGAVFKLPPLNSSFNDGCFMIYSNYLDAEPDLQQGTAWRYRAALFMQVPNASRVPVIEEQLKPLAEFNNKVREDFIITGFKLDPLVGMAVRDEYADTQGTWTRDASPLAAVLGTAVMAIFVLLIACFNLTNTSIAISSGRLKEIGIRKVMGSMRKQLVVQFIGETMMVCLLSLLIGMVIAEIFLIPAFNELWPYMKLTSNYFGDPSFLLIMIAVLVFTGLLAGSYPAFYISKFQPTAILKGKMKFGGTNYFTRVLLALQFGISLIAIVCSFAFTDNARYQRDFDMGYNKKGVVFTWVNNEDEYNALSNVMLQNSDVTSIAGAEYHLYSSGYNDPIKHGEKEIEVDILHVGHDYLNTVGLTLIEGRNFVKDSETDRRESVIITEKVATLFGMDKPIGKEIIWLDTVRFYVVGVVKDIYNNGLWREMDPVMIRLSPPKDYKHLIISAGADKIVSINQDMEKKWKQIFPNRKFNSRYMDEDVVEAGTVNVNIVKMFVFLGIVAMMLSVTGLFTMVSLNIIKRMKEIGVRKVLGASIGNISRVINTEFVIILLIASLIGADPGYFMAEMLMNSIWDFYQRATITTMTTSAAIMLVASALTVSLKTYRTARMNPVNVLRDE